MNIEQNKVRVTKYFHENAWTKALNMRGVFSQSKTIISAPLDRKTNRVKTGLEGNSKLQAQLEKELGHEPGTLSPTNKAFWADFQIVIPVGGKTLDLSLAEHQLEYAVLSVRNDVAKGTEELKMKLHGGNENVFIMTSENDEAQVKNTKRSYTARAYTAYSAMGPDEMRDVLIFFGRHAYGLSEEMLRDKTGELIDMSPKTFLEVIENPDFKDVVFINKCLFHGILNTKGKAIIQDGSPIGSDIQGAIEFLNDPKSQTIKFGLMAELERKEGGTKGSKTKK